MNTTVNLANIHHHKHTNFCFFLVITTFKMYSLSNFQICNTMFLTTIPMLYITFPELIYLVAGLFFFFFFYLLTIFIPSPILAVLPTPASGNPNLFLSTSSGFFFFFF